MRKLALLVLHSYAFVFLMTGAFFYVSTFHQARHRANDSQVELFEDAIKALELNAVRIEEGDDRHQVAGAMLAAAARLRVEQRDCSLE